MMQKPKRAKRTPEQIFIDKLNELLKAEPSGMVSNQTVQDALGWEYDRYHAMRKNLLKQNKLVRGRGQGGKIGLSQETKQKSVKLFISYSHSDLSYKNELIKHLHPLKYLNLIEAWHDSKIEVGQDLEVEIMASLNSCDIVLLLISSDYLNSFYCIEKELSVALERNARGEVVIIPVIIRNCFWKEMPFGKLKATPPDALAVISWPNQDEAFTKVIEDIHKRISTVVG